jgi:hypothetical protein
MTSPDRALGRMDPAALRLVIGHANDEVFLEFPWRRDAA